MQAMRLPSFTLALLVVAAPAMPAEKDKVELEFDKSADFASYKTFAWVPFQEQLPNRANHLRITRAVVRELLAKGLTESNPVEADICLEYHARLEKKARGTPSIEDSAWQPSSPKFIVNIDRVEMGTLVLDVWDSHRKDVVWQAKTTEPMQSEDMRDRQISAVVKRLLAHYPPAPESGK
jgi:hypothetical protein